MKASSTDRAHADQARQRIRVGMIGLAAVVLLIGIASAIFSTVNREQPVTATGAAKPDVVANMAVPGTAPSPATTNEPLAELGVTPATKPDSAAGAERP